VHMSRFCELGGPRLRALQSRQRQWHMRERSFGERWPCLTSWKPVESAELLAYAETNLAKRFANSSAMCAMLAYAETNLARRFANSSAMCAMLSRLCQPL